MRLVLKAHLARDPEHPEQPEEVQAHDDDDETGQTGDRVEGEAEKLNLASKFGAQQASQP